ncbi:MAG: hypothetical protein ACYCR3_10660 [Acidithiobacillus sp.]
MPESDASLWFNAPQTWVIPVLKMEKDCAVSGVAETASAAQVSGADAIWTFGARYPEDVPALMSARVGDWVVEMDDGHRRLFSDAEFRDQFVPSGMELVVLSYETQRQADEQRTLAGYQEGAAYRRGLAAADRLSAFAQACLELGERNAWPNSAQENRPRAVPAKGDGMESVSRTREKIVGAAVEKMRQAFAGDLPLTVWITRTVRQEFPVDMVQKVMHAISEHGGESGGPVVFDSVSRHRDTALDAILRSGSEYTMGIPIEDSLSQKQWESRGIRASSRMVDLTREMLAPLEMAAIRQASPGEVVSLPFNRDGFFDDKINAPKRDPQHRGQGDA